MEGKIVKWKFKNDIKYLTIDGWSNAKLQSISSECEAYLNVL